MRAFCQEDSEACGLVLGNKVSFPCRALAVQCAPLIHFIEIYLFYCGVHNLRWRKIPLSSSALSDFPRSAPSNILWRFHHRRPASVKSAPTLSILAGRQDKAVPQFITIHVDSLRPPRSSNRWLWLPWRILCHVIIDSWLQSPHHRPIPQ